MVYYCTSSLFTAVSSANYMDNTTLKCFSHSMQSIQNLGLAVIAIIAGKIVDDRGYLVLEVFFQICLCGKYQVRYLTIHDTIICK